MRQLSLNYGILDEEEEHGSLIDERDVLLKDPMGDGSQVFQTEEEIESQRKINRAHRLMNVVSFVLNMEYSIILPTLFFYVERLHANAVMYGWIAASFSIASFLATFLYGHWVDARPSREPLAFGIIMLIGTTLYGLGFGSVWVLLGGRILAGFGAGVRVICLNYFVRTTSVQERTQKIANFYAVGMVGMITAPGLSLLMHFIDTELFGFKIDQVTLPGYLMSAIGIVLLVCLFIFIYDPPEMSTAKAPPPVRLRDLPVGMIPLLLNQVICVASITSFELLVVPLISERYHWGSLISSLVFVAVGVLVFSSAFVTGMLSKKVEDRKLLLIGMAFFILGCILDFDFEDIGVHLPLGVFIFFFCASILCVSVGFTMAFSSQPGLYSKLIYQIPNKGVLMSWLSSAGSIARIIGPLIVAYTLQVDENIVLIAITAGLFVATVVTAIFFKHLRLQMN